jgi:DNA repair protein RecN (Recombination protein N)
MLNLLKIKNIALIDSIEIEFGVGLNLLTGETGSGKSIIVDSLGALTGDRVSSDLIKDGSNSARIEGLFTVVRSRDVVAVFDDSGVETDDTDEIELIVRREISSAGKNRIFINNQMVTAGFLKRLGPFLVDIHGQGEHAALFDPSTHLDLLDEYTRDSALLNSVATVFKSWWEIKAELSELEKNESEKLQLIDILKFQVDEIRKADPKLGEEAELEEEKRRLNNVEKLSLLSDDALKLLYEADESTVTTLEKASRKIMELAEFDSRFGEYTEGLQAAQAVLEDLSFAVRDFSTHLEFSPERLAEIEDRLAEITRISRKYGGTVESALDHLSESEAKLDSIENAEFRQEEVRRRLAEAKQKYLDVAGDLHAAREKAASKFAKEVESNLSAVALEKAKFEVRIDTPNPDDETRFSANGFSRVEFFFSANVGEPVKPLARVASGGEASRLMLILKTTAKAKHLSKAVVFDEIDAGIGGRVAEAVGLKLKELANGQQVLCVTHQPQVASQADAHFLVEKSMSKNRTSISIRELNKTERIEEVARMLAGEKITDAARENAREMIAAAG